MAITIDGKTCRNMPEQVQKNKDDIEGLASKVSTLENKETDVVSFSDQFSKSDDGTVSLANPLPIPNTLEVESGKDLIISGPAMTDYTYHFKFTTLNDEDTIIYPGFYAVKDNIPYGMQINEYNIIIGNLKDPIGIGDAGIPTWGLQIYENTCSFINIDKNITYDLSNFDIDIKNLKTKVSSNTTKITDLQKALNANILYRHSITIFYSGSPKIALCFDIYNQSSTAFASATEVYEYIYNEIAEYDSISNLLPANGGYNSYDLIGLYITDDEYKHQYVELVYWNANMVNVSFSWQTDPARFSDVVIQVL